MMKFVEFEVKFEWRTEMDFWGRLARDRRDHPLLPIFMNRELICMFLAASNERGRWERPHVPAHRCSEPFYNRIYYFSIFQSKVNPTKTVFGQKIPPRGEDDRSKSVQNSKNRRLK
jgi:hypothetical protein